MLVEYIDEYLLQKDKTLEEALLEACGEAFKESVRRQFMVTREESGGLRGSLAGPCARKMGYKFLQFPVTATREPRSFMTFATGDALEILMTALVKLAGVKVEGTCLDPGGQLDIYFDCGNGILVPCHADGFVLPQPGITDKKILLEVKSTTDYGFKDFLKGNISDGYKLQNNVYMEAYGVDASIFLVINKMNGKYHEIYVEKDPEIVEWARNNYTLAGLCDEENLPPRYEDGKDYGRFVNKDGVVTNRLAWGCSGTYCDYHGHCYPESIVTIERGRPVYSLPEPEIHNDFDFDF